MRFFFALLGGLIELLVVGERVRVRANHVSMNERRPAALANVVNSFLTRCVAFYRIGAIDFGHVQPWKIAHQFRDAAAGGLHFDGDGNCVAVVFDEIKQRQFFGAGGVERFPEFAFAGGAVAGGNVNNFVAFVMDVLAERGFLGLRERFRAISIIELGFGGTRGLYDLRSGAGRFADDVPFGVTPVRRHLASAGSWVVCGTDGLQQSLQRRDAEHQAQGAVAIVRVGPVDAGAKEQSYGGGNGFVTGARNLEVNFVLALELNLTVVETPRKKHGAINADQRFAVEAVILGGVELGYL